MQITLSAARYGRIRPEKWQNAHLKMAIPELYERNSKRSVLEALSDTRVVFLLGARQVGKSTLARRIATNEHPATIVDLDDPVPRKATFDDPVGFVTSLDRPVFVDEIQRGDPELVLAIKSVVDRDMSPGHALAADAGRDGAKHGQLRRGSLRRRPTANSRGDARSRRASPASRSGRIPTGPASRGRLALALVRQLSAPDDRARSGKHRRRLQAVRDPEAAQASGQPGSQPLRTRLAGQQAFPQPSDRCGCVIHLGADTIPLGDRLFALPLSVLWA